jgi:hypothetical protein
MSMDAWTIGLFLLAAFVAVTALARLMLARRDRLLAELSAQAREQQHRQQLAEMAERRKKKKKATSLT